MSSDRWRVVLTRPGAQDPESSTARPAPQNAGRRVSSCRSVRLRVEGSVEMARRPQRESERGSCPADDLLAALADGQLPEPELSETEEHVDACIDCQATLRLFARLSQPEPTERAKLDSASAQTPMVGEVVSSRYRLTKELGRGSQGIVFSAHDRLLGRDVALKFIRLTSPWTQARFTREGRAIAGLDHPNILKVFDAYTTLHHGVLSMPLCSRTLRGVQMPWPDAKQYFEGIAAGLTAIHAAGLVHRDIKPSNLFVGPDDVVTIGDFGLARAQICTISGDLNATRRGFGVQTVDTGLVGTPAFMAPELFEGAPHSAATDQYAFFASLFCVLTGRPPRVKPRWPDGVAPAWLRAVIERGLSPDPRRRFASVAAAAEALRPRRLTRLRRSGLLGTVSILAVLALFLAAPPAQRRVCNGLATMPWTSDRAAAIEAAVHASGDPDAATLAREITAALSQYSADTATAAASMCRAHDPSRGQSPGLQCLERHAERVRALADRLAAGNLAPDGARTASNLLPTLLSFGHCERTRAAAPVPYLRRPLLAARVYGAWAESQIGAEALGHSAEELLLSDRELDAIPDLRATLLLRWASREALDGDGNGRQDVRAVLGQAIVAAELGNDPVIEARVRCERARVALNSLDDEQARMDLSFARAALARAGAPAAESIGCDLIDAAHRMYGDDLDGALALARRAGVRRRGFGEQSAPDPSAGHPGTQLAPARRAGPGDQNAEARPRVDPAQRTRPRPRSRSRLRAGLRAPARESAGGSGADLRWVGAAIGVGHGGVGAPHGGARDRISRRRSTRRRVRTAPGRPARVRASRQARGRRPRRRSVGRGDIGGRRSRECGSAPAADPRRRRGALGRRASDGDSPPRAPRRGSRSQRPGATRHPPR